MACPAFAALVLGAAVVAGGRQAAVRTVPNVDLTRYAGEWFELARFPNRFQKKCAGDVRARYTRRQDGRFDVVNSCTTVEGRTTAVNGVARVVDRDTGARLEVRFAPAVLSFLPFVWGDYWIIGLADDYSWAVVGSPDRKYLWILARTPELKTTEYDAALEAARANGFDTTRLVRTPQSGRGAADPRE